MLHVLLAGVASLASCDPVHDSATAALGDEAPGVRKGPLHRPGQPCTTCHDGATGNPPKFTVAGTIFVDEQGKSPANGAVITLTDATNKTHTATTNTAGNFYVQPSEFTPAYPMRVSVAYGKITIVMKSEVGRDASCAGCHTYPASPTSPGLVFIPSDGVTP